MSDIKMKSSNRGFYTTNKNLLKTAFTVGSKYNYIIDVRSNKIFIRSSSAGNTVSKRTLKNIVKPVIDIRDSKVKDITSNCDYLMMKLYKDYIVVTGCVEKEVDNTNSIFGFKKHSTKAIKLKKVFQFKIDLSLIKQAVGSEEYYTDDNIPFGVLSICSGAGFLDAGFVKQGFKIIKAMEWKEKTCKTYARNISNVIEQTDLTQLTDKDIDNLPKNQFLVGGPNCQGMSNANRINNELNNPKNELVKIFVKMVKGTNANGFLMEEVPGLLTNPEFAPLKEAIFNELKGYNITSGILCAADYDSPQLRDRAIIIGTKMVKVDLPKPTVKVYKTVGEAFAGLNDSISNQTEYVSSGPDVIERMKYVKMGGNFEDIPLDLRTKGTQSNYHKRLDLNAPSITLCNPVKAIMTHPFLNRIISIRECARLMDVPDSYVFFGKGYQTANYQMLCNGVPINLAEAVARAIKEAFMRVRLI